MSDERFHLLFGNSLDAMVIADEQGKYLDVNQAACDLFGYTRGQMLQMSIGDLMTLHNSSAAEQYQKYLQTERETGEFTFVRADNQVRVASYSACRLAPGQHLSILRDITHQKQAEEQRSRSETRFRTLVEQSPLSIQILSPDGRTLQVNRAWEQLWGVTLEDIRDYNMLEDKQLVDRGIMPYIQRGFAGEAVTIPPILYDPEQTIPKRTRNPNPQRWTQAFMYPVKDEAGQIREVVLIHEDITERVQAEEALRQSEKQFRFAIEAMQEGLSIIDATGQFVLCNQSALYILGLTYDQMMGRTALDPRWHTLHEDGSYFPHQQHPILVSLRTGLAVSGVIMGVYKPNGEITWIEVNSAPLLRLGEERPYGAVATFTDITQRRILHDALRRSEERYRTLVVATAQIVWTTDASGAITGQADSWGDFTGQVLAEYMGWGWIEAIHPDDREHTATIWKEALRSRYVYECEYRLRRRDGTYRYMLARGVPLIDEQGNVREWIGTNTDITEREQHLEEIENLNARLKRSLQETHHRIKNNLQIISALTDIQIEEGKGIVPATAMMRVGQHARSLAALHDLLTQQAKADAQTNTVSTQAVMNKLIPLLQPTTAGRLIRFQVEDTRLPVQDGTSLALLVSELVSNAVKHGKGEIELTFQVSGNTARLEVCDDGPGFPAGFDPQVAGNTGLSLIDSTGRYELGGTISYGNRAEGGARVSVTFPLSAIISG